MIQHLETFLIAGILLNLTPGNDTIFILSKSIGQGRKAGIISAFGIAAGTIVHTLLAAFGLSLIIAESVVLFNIIKYAGAAYLLYIGYKMITDKTVFQLKTDQSELKRSYKIIFRDAAITNILNPKVGLFFISFLPQFIVPGTGNASTGFLLLGLCFIITGLTWCLILAWFASVIFSKMIKNPWRAQFFSKICGTVLIALAIKISLADRK